MDIMLILYKYYLMLKYIMDFKNLLNSLPTLNDSEDLPITLNDIQLEHESLTLENPLTYIIYLDRCKTLSIEDRNDIFKIISKLYANQQVIKKTVFNNFEDSSITVKSIEDEEKQLNLNNIV